MKGTRLSAPRLSAPGVRISIICALALAWPGALWAGEGQPQPTKTVAKQAQPAPRQQAGRLKVARPANSTTTILFWTGANFPPMAGSFAKAIEDFKATSTRFLVVLDSPGGSVTESEKVIALLQDLKKTHVVDTAVHAGSTCGSMCPFIYAQGQVRMAAPASLWVFHEILVSSPTGTPQYLDRQGWIGLVDKYFLPAGVSPDWIEEMKVAAKGRDYFVSGDGLIAKGAGLVTKAITDSRPRNIPQG